MINIVGYVGGLLFAFCAAPQAYKCYKDGHSRGMTQATLWMWFFGEILTIWYVWESKGFDGPLMFNYFMNLVFVIFIMKYKYFERTESNTIVINKKLTKERHDKLVKRLKDE